MDAPQSQLEVREPSIRYELDAEPDRPAAASVTELWDWSYSKGMEVDSARKAAGVRAMKKALVDHNYGNQYGVIVTLPAWGDAADKATKAFQAAEHLQADGVIGRVTARHLFRMYAGKSETYYDIPDELVQHVKSWESQNDPVARSATGDEGIAQINPPSHPDITIAQMWDPYFALHFVGGYLRGSFIYVGGDWDGAVAAYNIGGGTAKKWVTEGKPSSGGPTLGTDSSGAPIDAWERASFYVEHVKASIV